MMARAVTGHSANRMRILGPAAALAVGLLTACSPSEASIAEGDDPMRALEVGVPSARYSHDFWVKEARAGTAVWDRAYGYCSAVWASGETATRPNCGHVRTADFATAAGRRGIRSRDMGVDANTTPP